MSEYLKQISERAESHGLKLQNIALTGVDENDPKSVARWMKKMGREMGEDVGDDLDAAMEDDMAGGAGEDGDASGSGDNFGERP